MSTIRILVVGDTHRNRQSAVASVERAAQLNTTHIIQLGDFGLWTREALGIAFLDAIEEACRKYGIQFVWLDGNHEDFDALQAFMHTTYRTDKGFFPIRGHVLYSPRGNVWTWDNKRFMTVGGAVSIDKQWRTPDVDWFEQETIKDSDVHNVLETVAKDNARGKPVNYLFSHECSDRTPFYDRLKPDLDSKINRQKFDKILDAVAPDWHFHGHMHTVYCWDRPVIKAGVMTDKWTQVRGLECDGMKWNSGILDTNEDSFVFVNSFTGTEKFNPLNTTY